MVKHMKAPIIAINYKAYYPYSFGKHAIRIAEAAIKVWEETGARIILAPPFTELRAIVKTVSDTPIKVFAQHADPIKPGAHTGFIPLEGLKDTGIHGVIINHSEHRLKLADINWLIHRAHEIDLEVLVCADVPETGAAAAVLAPDYVAVEPPELIGTGISVSKAKPEIITGSVNLIRRVNEKVTILTGAGISRGEDVEAAIKLGTSGVLVASAIVKSENPYHVIRDMAISGLRALQG